MGELVNPLDGARSSGLGILDPPAVGSHPTATSYFAELASVLAQVPAGALARVVDLLLETRATGQRVYIMGNGGSAATASHFACDLMKTARVPGLAPLRVVSLTDNVPLLTAWANDSAYEDTFAQQVAALVEPGDLVIGISASGNSPNIVAGFRAAAAHGARTIGILGFDGGRSLDLVDVAVHVPCHHYGLVEDTHAAVGHAVTAALREALQAQVTA